MTELSHDWYSRRRTEFDSHPLAECDHDAYERLSNEIAEVRESGYVISIGDSLDESYLYPERISAIYEYLHKRDLLLEQERQRIIASGIGSVGINPFKRAYRREKRIYDQLEPLRDELLFCEQESDSRPWHRQRGRAAALLTIAAAHDLDDGSGGKYATISGPLNSRVVDFRFPLQGTGVDGLSLTDAVAKTEVEYSGRDDVAARQIAERRVEELREFTEWKASPRFKEIVQYCSDSLGIRSRKQEVHQAISDHIESVVARGDKTVGDVLMMSYGCGTALPMLEILQQVRDNTGETPRLILIDQDPLALAAAAVLAEDMGLAGNIELHCRRLFDKLFRPIDIESVLAGRQLDVVEDSGLREYLPDSVYRRLTHMTWQHLAEGGLMSTGNMNRNRPQAEFLHGMMGWQPKVQMRHIAEGLALHRAAGIPASSTRARVTSDGIYTLFFSQK